MSKKQEVLSPTEIRGAALRYVAYKKEIDALNKLLKEEKKTLLELGNYEDSLVTVKISIVAPTIIFDTKTFKEENMDLYAKYNNKTKKGYTKLSSVIAL